jgi:hypothetical protein
MAAAMMYKKTIFFGVLMLAAGLAGYFGTDAKQMMDLIPPALGLILLVCGFLASNENRRMMAMHIAILVGLIGAIVIIPILFIKGQPAGALAAKSVTLVLCVIFVGLCIRSFIEARKAREAAAAESGEDPAEDSDSE